MLAAADAATPAELPIRFVHARAERLPFADGVFDLAQHHVFPQLERPIGGPAQG
jgi:ubiquinone/menaquinone biosynthesis C-methylase UbiE